MVVFSCYMIQLMSSYDGTQYSMSSEHINICMFSYPPFYNGVNEIWR